MLEQQVDLECCLLHQRSGLMCPLDLEVWLCSCQLNQGYMSEVDLFCLNWVCSQWQGVVDRLALLQRTKLEEVIDKVRQELVVFWDKCMFGPEQREPFNVHFCDGEYNNAG